MEEPKDWFEAQAHCRLTYTDLSSIRNQSDNDKITALLTGITRDLFTISSTSSQFAWTGLHRPMWVWSDGSDSSFRQWNLFQSSGREDCVIMSPFSLTWYWKSCYATYTFLCQKGDSSPAASLDSDPAGLIRFLCLFLQTSYL